VSERIAIIGDGAMGTVCAMLLAGKGHEVTIWGAFRDNIEAMARTRTNERFLPGYSIPDSVRLTHREDDVFAEATFVVSAVPCQHVRSAWSRLKEYVPRRVPICSVAKGIENETLLRPTQIIRDVIGDGRMAVLSGPSIANELARCLPASVVAASEDDTLARHIQELFSTEWFRVYRNTDVLGVELAAATKNVVALAAGIIDGLRVGDNCKAALLTRGLVEITRLGVALGAEKETFSGLAGMGDLVTTCISPHGRNRSAGELFGKGKKLDEVLASTASVIEGIPTTRSVMQLARNHNIEMPITQAVHDVVFDGKDPIVAITELMTRRLKAE
jgi:glycerol-3-phosphate dehydrogenase (NAD(P)+)